MPAKIAAQWAQPRAMLGAEANPVLWCAASCGEVAQRSVDSGQWTKYSHRSPSHPTFGIRLNAMTSIHYGHVRIWTCVRDRVWTDVQIARFTQGNAMRRMAPQSHTAQRTTVHHDLLPTSSSASCRMSASSTSLPVSPAYRFSYYIIAAFVVTEQLAANVLLGQLPF